MRYPISKLVPVLALTLIFAGCQSQPESNVKQPESAQTKTAPPESDTDAVQITGSAAQRAWNRHFTNAINTATESFAHWDTTGAIRIADSLRVTCEGVLDTLAQDDTQSQFLMVVVADLYGKLRMWKSMQGDQEGVAALTEDYAGLVRRMHDKAATAKPDLP